MPNWNKTLKAISIAFFATTLSAGVALADPTLHLVWSSTTGIGVTGGSDIEASAGDELMLDVVVLIDANGFTGAAWDLEGTSGLAAASNLLPPGGDGPPECPSPPNLVPGTCFSATFKVFAPLAPGVLDLGSSTTDYDVAGLTAEFVPSEMTIGRGYFIVGDNGQHCVTTVFVPGIGGVTNGAFEFSVPPEATASVNGGCPESPGSPELSATKSDALTGDVGGDGQVDPGDTLTYTIVVANSGPADATAAVFSDSPDANTALVNGSATTTQGIVSIGNTAGDASVEVDLGTLVADGGSATIEFDVVVNDPLPAGVVAVSNQGILDSNETGGVPTDDPDKPGAADPTETPIRSPIDQCTDDLISCEGDLATCGGDLGSCEGDLSTCDGALGTCEGELGTCRTDLLSCELNPRFLDADGDGEHDNTDACPGTAPGEPVDAAGCSIAQYCAGLAVPATCNNGDWQGDELLGNAQDCKARSGSCEPR